MSDDLVDTEPCSDCAGRGHCGGEPCSSCFGTGELPRSRSADTSDELLIAIEAAAPSSLAAHLDPARPYDGQPHTFTGERGRREVHGLTLRDLMDCYVRASYEVSGLPVEQWPGTVYGLPRAELDPIALGQRLCLLVEQRMAQQRADRERRADADQVQQREWQARVEAAELSCVCPPLLGGRAPRPRFVHRVDCPVYRAVWGLDWRSRRMV